MMDSVESGSRRGVVGPFAESLFVFPPTVPMLDRFLSASFSRSLSLLLMYIRPRWCLEPFLPQVSNDCCFFRLWASEPGDKGSWLRSTLSLPMLSAADVSDPLLDGRETPPLLRRESRPFRPEDSRAAGLFGDLGAVRADKPLGGLEVRMTGALAGRSSKGPSSSWSCFRDGWE
jgi:hypothetical protein